MSASVPGLLLLLLPALPGTVLQEPAPSGEGATQAAPPALAPEALAVWRSFVDAARSPSATEPVHAFELAAHVRTRQGVQTNELEVVYRFLEPHFIRFRLPGDRETGRGPGARGGFWLRDGEEVVQLAGREYTEDRDQVLRMASLARNFLALTDPERIRLERAELLERPDFTLPDAPLRRLARRLTWVRVASPSFALAEAMMDGRQDVVYRVDLGLDRDSHLPALVAIRADDLDGLGPAGMPTPLLIHLEDYRGRSGFVVPHLLLVYEAERLAPAPVFGERPAQEIAVTRVDLRPELTPEDFLP